MTDPAPRSPAPAESLGDILAQLDQQRKDAISRHDEIAAEVGRAILFPGPLVRTALLVARAREARSVPAIIEALAT